MTEESEVLSPDEAHARVITELSRTIRPELMTELNDQEIKALSVVMTVGEETKNDVMTSYGEWFMRLRVSKGRKGRDELIRVSRSPDDLDEKVKKGVMQYIMRK